MAQVPFFTGRSHEDGQLNTETNVESRTPTILGSLVDCYGTGFYLRPESGIKVFRNNNKPTTGLICGASVSRIVFPPRHQGSGEGHILYLKNALETYRVHLACVAISSGPRAKVGHSLLTFFAGRRHPEVMRPYYSGHS